MHARGVRVFCRTNERGAQCVCVSRPASCIASDVSCGVVTPFSLPPRRLLVRLLVRLPVPPPAAAAAIATPATARCWLAKQSRRSAVEWPVDNRSARPPVKPSRPATPPATLRGSSLAAPCVEFGKQRTHVSRCDRSRTRSSRESECVTRQYLVIGFFAPAVRVSRLEMVFCSFVIYLVSRR